MESAYFLGDIWQLDTSDGPDLVGDVESTSDMTTGWRGHGCGQEVHHVVRFAQGIGGLALGDRHKWGRWGMKELGSERGDRGGASIWGLGELDWSARIEGGWQGRMGRKIDGAAGRGPPIGLREGAESAVVRGVDGLDTTLRNGSMGRRWVDDRGWGWGWGCGWLAGAAWRRGRVGKVETGAGGVVSWRGDGRQGMRRGTPVCGGVERDVVVVVVVLELLGEGWEGRGGEGVVGGH